MVAKRKLKYIECPSCKIGGYDFCPSCLGGGGYSIEVDEESQQEDVFIKDSKLGSINKKLDLISSTNIENINGKVEDWLNKAFFELSNSHYNESIVEALKRIIKIRKAIYRKRKLKEISNELKAIKEIIVDFFGNSSDKSGAMYFIGYNEMFYEKGHVPINNEFFGYIKEHGITIKITKNKCASLSQQLLEKFFDNLYQSRLLDLSQNSNDFDFNVEMKIRDQTYRKGILKLRIILSEINYLFLVHEKVIKELVVMYFAALQSKEIRGWQYIDMKS